ncbi:helix-turn-helix domain-containing protein [Caproicibacter sp.]|uniref:helix-turn-helix domain-containing protein n=1 Tax=Caproicibacter sp. TaxID=2814884 RepID=UPI00398A2F3E
MRKANRSINSYDQLPLILTVEHISQIMGISRVGAYELTKTDGFPVIRVGRRITIPKIAFIEWLDEKAQNRGE